MNAKPREKRETNAMVFWQCEIKIVNKLLALYM